MVKRKKRGWFGAHKRHVEAGKKGARRRKGKRTGLTGHSKTGIDRMRTARHQGKRTSKSGKTYYEYRRNRSDKNRRKKL